MTEAIKSTLGDGEAAFAAKYPDLDKAADRWLQHHDPDDSGGRDAMNIRDGFTLGYEAACDVLAPRLTDLSSEITRLRTLGMRETVALLDALKAAGFPGEPDPETVTKT